ncbi:MAG: hypothetical protein ACSLE6_19900 [Mycobacterium sp.]
MTRRGRTIAVLTLAGLAAVGCVVSWLQVRTPVDVAPIAEGQAPTTSMAYSGSWITLALFLATVAGVCVVIGVARLRDGRR